MEASGDVDLNHVIASSWDKLLKTTQKEARDFLAQSQTKNLEGSTLYAFFNKRLVSICSTNLDRTSIDSSLLREMAIACLT